MYRRQALICYVLIAASLLTVLLARATETRTGSWTISRTDEPGKVEFSLTSHQHGRSSHHQSAWSVSQFQGLDYAKAGRQDVKFTIKRDAGLFECHGYLEDGEGAGVFHFS